MRIAFLITGLGLGGAEKLLYDLSLGLSKRGHQILVINLMQDEYYSKKLRDAHITTISLGISPSPSINLVKIGRLFSSLFRLVVQLKRFQPDLLHTWLYPADLFGGVVGFCLRIPVIWGIFSGKTDRNLYKWHVYLIMKACAHLSNVLPKLIISCSAHGRKSHTAFGYPKKKIIFVPIGINTANLNSPSTTQNLLYSSNNPTIVRIGMLARYAPEKDHILLLESIARLKHHKTLFHLFLAGGSGIDSLNDELAHTIDRLQLNNEVSLLGRIENVADFFSFIDIFCLFSNSEGFPTVIPEAMTARLPCLATDAGDAKLILSDENQITVCGKKDEAYSKLSRLCLMSNDARQTMGDRNRTRITNIFTQSTMVTRYINAYQETLSQRTSLVRNLY